MKKGFLIICTTILYSFCDAQKIDYASYADPFVGTGGHGHTYPGATVPYGMVQLSPDTRLSTWDGCSGYHYSDSIIFGFTHTHLSGGGCLDYGDILFMPTTGTPSPDRNIYSSSFSHKNEKASPGFYAVKLNKSNINVELTTTTRAGLHKYIINRAEEANIILDLTHRDKVLDSYLKIVSKTQIEGYRISRQWAKEQRIYFFAEFSRPVDKSGIWLKNKLRRKLKEAKSTDIKAFFTFNTLEPDTIYVRIGISTVSIEGARKNLNTELHHLDFEKVKKEARALWNKELGKIEIKSSNVTLMKNFYTALYHCMIAPNVNMDVDSAYRGRDNQIHKAEGFTNYQVFSLWDTFRALHPLMTIIDQKRTLDFIKTFIIQYEQGGRLPVWELACNETDCMIGYHSVPVIVDAAVKGIKNFNLIKALEAMKKSANWNHYGIPAYIQQGYISIEDDNESVSKTLEYAYDDWCIAKFAQLLQKQSDYEEYIQRGQYYKNIFDTETGFMRPKINGNWLSPFNPKEVNNHYTEANAWQYTFFVPQDIEGLIGLMGGNQKFCYKLDELFTTSSQMSGREQPDITGLIGQYAHGNEPSHHMAYLYNFAAAPWATQSTVHRICNEFYTPGPDGLIGNEDCGQMSAWYVFSAMGFYPVTPGLPYYTIGSPMFEEVKIHLENGNTFTIIAKNVSKDNFYISSAILNGNNYGKSYIQHDDIMKGGEITFTMERFRNTIWGTQGENLPVSAITDYPITTAPIITAEGLPFRKQLTISMKAGKKNDLIYYTINDKGMNAVTVPYTGPFKIDDTKTYYTWSESSTGKKSKTVKAVFKKFQHPDWRIKLESKYSVQYSAGGDDALIDGHLGTVEWRKGGWQGYRSDFSAIVDLGKEIPVKRVSAGFLQDADAWIIMPKSVTFSFSTDGKKFSDDVTIKNNIADNDYKVQMRDFLQNISTVNARFVKVKALNYGKLPEWHQGKGEDAWLFIDHIDIQ